MSVEFTLEQFSGPLDLLLSLLDDQKLSISDISLSHVTEQYLYHIEQLEETNAQDLADFLLVATRLLLLKSRALLPQFLPEEDEGPDLADQLRLYKAFIAASKKVHDVWLSSSRSVFRVEPPRKAEGFVPPQNLTLDEVRKSMVQLVSRLKPRKPLPQTRIDSTVSMKQKIHHIRTLLKNRKKAGFHELVASRQNRTELIVSFLALLELAKQKTVSLHQEETFSDIMIHAT